MTRPFLFCLLCFSAAASAITTSHWNHTSEADFKAGTLQNVVASNLGDLKLSRGLQVLLDQDPRFSSVNAIAQGADGAIYAATGPRGMVLSIHDGKTETIWQSTDDSAALSLLIDAQGRLLVGTGGERAAIWRLDKPQPKQLFSADGVQYIWAMTQAADGTIYAATGPHGQLFQIAPDGKSTVLFSCPEHNLLSLLSDEADKLYIGTDPNGLVYRVDRKSGQSFVLFNAAESEISALAMDKAGNVYAATAAQQEGATEQALPSEKNGRPEAGSAGGVAIPTQEPDMPKPPALPNPNPGEPPPIPRTQPPHLLILPEATEPPTASTPASSPDDGEEPPTVNAVPASQPAMRPAGGPASTPHPGGNAIYRITPAGIVSEIFRQPVLVLSMIQQDGKLIVGTGSEGLIYQVDPAAEETLVLAKVDAKQVLAMCQGRDGRVLLGMANSGAVVGMSQGFAKVGTYTSPVLDATQASQFGQMHLLGRLPEGSALQISTRCGNVRTAADGQWSSWSEPASATEYFPISSPSARFLQYRLLLTSGNGEKTPRIEEVDVAYQLPNLSPQVKSLRATVKAIAVAVETEEAAGGASGQRHVAWTAFDPNGDTLSYALWYRLQQRDPWILLKDKLKETQFDWDTRLVADGRYELKVVATDAASNPVGQALTGSRVSDSIAVDNTAPVIGDVKTTAMATGVTVELTVADRASSVASVEFSVDSHDDWRLAKASDKLFDSPREAASFAVENLTSGPHQIAVRATDAMGNAAYQTILVTIPPQAEKKKD